MPHLLHATTKQCLHGYIALAPGALQDTSLQYNAMIYSPMQHTVPTCRLASTSVIVSGSSASFIDHCQSPRRRKARACRDARGRSTHCAHASVQQVKSRNHESGSNPNVRNPEIIRMRNHQMRSRSWMH